MEDKPTRPKLTGILTGMDDKIQYEPIAPRDRKWQVRYSKAIAEEICDAIAANPTGMRHIFRDKENNDEWPSRCTFFYWMRGDSEQAVQLRAMYDAARQEQIESLIEENLSIVHGEIRDNIELGVARLQCDEHWRQASKIAPRKYGDKMALVTKVEEDMDLVNIKEVIHGIKDD